MFCPKCGTENDDNAQFCKGCGETLQKTHTPTNSSSQAKGSKNMLIICAAIILCVLIVAGAFVLMNNSSSDSNNSNVVKENTDSSVDTNDESSSKSNSMRIMNGTIANGYSTDGKAHCSFYVGTEHANEHVQISVLFKAQGLALNEGKIVPTTVTSDGYVYVKSADMLAELPDYADINLYDEDGNLLDNRIENLDDSGYTEF